MLSYVTINGAPISGVRYLRKNTHGLVEDGNLRIEEFTDGNEKPHTFRCIINDGNASNNEENISLFRKMSRRWDGDSYSMNIQREMERAHKDEKISKSFDTKVFPCVTLNGTPINGVRYLRRNKCGLVEDNTLRFKESTDGNEKSPTFRCIINDGNTSSQIERNVSLFCEAAPKLDYEVKTHQKSNDHGSKDFVLVHHPKLDDTIILPDQSLSTRSESLYPLPVWPEETKESSSPTNSACEVYNSFEAEEIVDCDPIQICELSPCIYNYENERHENCNLPGQGGKPMIDAPNNILEANYHFAFDQATRNFDSMSGHMDDIKPPSLPQELVARPMSNRISLSPKMNVRRSTSVFPRFTTNS